MLGDKLEQLFHKKSIPAYSAWNRLFDDSERKAQAGSTKANNPTPPATRKIISPRKG
jgi:hypothetical protein